MTRDAAIAKIRKLLELASNPGATEDEANNAHTRARALMNKHGISISDVFASQTSTNKNEPGTPNTDHPMFDVESLHRATEEFLFKVVSDGLGSLFKKLR